MYNEIKNSLILNVRRDQKLEVTCHNLKCVSAEKVTKDTNLQDLAIAMICASLETLAAHNIVPEWTKHKKLVTYDLACDVHDNKQPYFLLLDMGKPYLHNENTVTLLAEDTYTFAKNNNFPLNGPYLARMLFEKFCQIHDLILVDMDDYEGIKKMHPEAKNLTEEHLINYFLGEKQDYSTWWNYDKKQIYLKCIDQGYDVQCANDYALIYDILGLDVGFETYERFCATCKDFNYPLDEMPTDIIEMSQYVVKSVEEECGDEYFIISTYAAKDTLAKNIAMAAKYAVMPTDFLEFIKNLDLQEVFEELQEYDEHWKEMANYRAQCNGQETFNYYLEHFCGCTLKPLVCHFEYEW